MRPGRAADHSPPSSVTVMEEQSYTSTHLLGHTGPVTGSLYLYQYITKLKKCIFSLLWDAELLTETFYIYHPTKHQHVLTLIITLMYFS